MSQKKHILWFGKSFSNANKQTCGELYCWYAAWQSDPCEDTGRQNNRSTESSVNGTIVLLGNKATPEYMTDAYKLGLVENHHELEYKTKPMIMHALYCSFTFYVWIKQNQVQLDFYFEKKIDTEIRPIRLFL